MASDFCKFLLKDSVGSREVINILVPDVRPEILNKIVEYIYIGCISLETRFMGGKNWNVYCVTVDSNESLPEFIEACNLLQLKATISCERKLVFDSPAISSSTTAAAAATTSSSGPTPNTSNLASIIADFDDNIKYSTSEDNNETEYEIKPQTNDSGQILEVYEISNIEDADITYDDGGGDDDTGEEHYELLNVIPSATTPLIEPLEILKQKIKTERKRKSNIILNSSDLNKSSPKMSAKTIDEAVMEQAINEIISNNTSFRVVSEKYQIPKTLLWRRAKKVGYVKTEKQKDEVRLLAIEAIKQGESLISLSKRFSIPISTLHREKLKLYEKGQLPESVNLKNRSRGEDYDERLRCAIAEILNGKSQNEIAKKYNIPKTTIWRIIKKIDLKVEPNQEAVTPHSEIVQQLLTLSKKRTIKEEPMDEQAIEIDKSTEEHLTMEMQIWN